MRNGVSRFGAFEVRYSANVNPLKWLDLLGAERTEKGQALYVLYVIIAVLVIIVLLKVLGVV